MIQRLARFVSASTCTLLGAGLYGCGDSTPPVLGTLHGSVSIEGDPIAGAEIRLEGHPASNGITGPDGRFEIVTPVGTYVVAVGGTPDDGRFDSPSRTVRLTESARLAELRFEGTWIRTSSVAGRVEAGGSGVAGVRVSASGPSTAQATSDADGAFLLDGLRAGQYEVAVGDYDEETYDFASVVAVATVAVGQRVEASFVAALKPPRAPTQLAATAQGPYAISLSWNDESSIEDEFRVERRDSAEWTALATLPRDSTAFADTDVLPATSYAYRVQACHSAGCSPFGAEAAERTAELVPQGNLIVPAAHVTQVVQDLDGSVPLLSGVGGLLRVFVAADGPNVHRPEVRVDLYHAGTLVQSSLIEAPGLGVPTTIREGSLADSWNLWLPGSLVRPGLEFLIHVDPSNRVPETNEGDNRYPASGTPARPEVRHPSPFPVVLVPVLQSATGLQGDVGDPAGFLELSDRILPTGDVTPTVRATYVTDAPALERDDGNGGWGTVLSEIAALRAADGSSAPYYGVVRVGYGSGIAGMGFIGATVAVGWDKSSRAAVAAHEWGHNFGRRHAPCGGASTPDPAYPHAAGRTGAWGYDRGDGSLRDPQTHYDVMSYCSPGWISDYTYVGILDAREGAATPSPGAPAAGLLIWGRIDGDAAVFEPAFDVTAPALLPRSGGPYRVQGLDPEGRELFSISFPGDELPEEAGGGRHFAFVIPESSFDRASLAALRLEGGGVATIRRPSRPAGARTTSSARRREDGAVDLRWDGARFPMALVRDAETGRIVSFARNGSVALPAGLRALDVAFSDGVVTVRQEFVPAR